MKLIQRIAQSPGGTPYANATVRVRRWSDSVTIATLESDADGFVTWEYDGHPDPFYLHLAGVQGGDKYWSSTDAMTTGALSLREVPVALRVLGDGVIRGVTSELAVSLVSGGPSVTVAPGAANVAGHPVGFYADTALAITRPESGTRVDRVVIRLNPEGSATTPGKAVLAILAGTVDAGAPALTQTATTHELSLAQLSVPSAGAIVLTDERDFSGEKPPVFGVVL